MQTNGVRSLLMGGQACIVYGAAEFSRDTDLAVLAEPSNLQRLELALGELQAERIAVPPFEKRYLDMGLAVHFRCRHPEAPGMRVDVLSKMRGVDPFHALWDRRTTLDLGDQVVELLSLPDLVLAKKTQRDKDWPMITRLVEASYFSGRAAPTREQVIFWLRELRTPELLIELAAAYPGELDLVRESRNLLECARKRELEALRSALLEEERREREVDRLYWGPLRKELERLRHERR